MRCLLTSTLAAASGMSSALISFSLAGTNAAILPVATCRLAKLKSSSLNIMIDILATEHKSTKSRYGGGFHMASAIVAK